jgi:2-succinyl-6-hydroxy-2,4-cyclohexadiene-1-carboxylate synthase
MGGRLALYLVCNFPDRFSKIVLESASPGLKTATQRQERIEQDEAIARQLEILALTDFLQQWYSNPLFASLKNHSSLYSALIHRRQNNDKAALAKALRGLGTGRQPSFWEKLSAINTPLLLLAGELDSKFVTIARDMAQHCQIGRTTSLKEIFEIHIFENCGHNIHLESPTYYIQVIAYFLDTASREEFMKEKLNEQSYDRRIHLRATLPPCRKIDRETT